MAKSITLKRALYTALFCFIITYGHSQRPKAKELGIEYLIPIHEDRQIKTVSSDLYYRWLESKDSTLTLDIGLIGTYAWGEITQLNDQFKDVIYNNKAAGLGANFLIRYKIRLSEKLSLSPYFKGGLVLYSKRFPYGGDVYNFMRRHGGTVHYLLNRNYIINISYVRMHVSNGQGLTQRNPSYEGQGINISIIKFQ